MGSGSSLESSDKVFSGTFDGKGKFISLYNYECKYQSNGCFGAVKGGTIQNLTVKGRLNVDSVTGGVVGWIQGGTIYNCRSECENVGNFHGHGGICGIAIDSHIDKCCNVGSVSGRYEVGGIVGSIYDNSRITSCYNTGDVTGTSFLAGDELCSMVGGLIGHLWKGRTCRIENSYSISNVRGLGYVGGLFGANEREQPAVFTNCYCVGTVTSTSGTAFAHYGAKMINISFNNCFTSMDIWNPGEVTNVDWGNSKTISESELKGSASALGSAFKVDTGNINKGFPILSWQ